MKKFIILATMFFFIGCTDNSVSPEPTEVSTNPVGTVTEPSDLTVPEETVTEPVTKSNPVEPIQTVASSEIAMMEKRYICNESIDWTGFDISDLMMNLIIGDWHPYTDFEYILNMESYGNGYLNVSKTRTKLARSGNCDADIRESVTNLYIINGIDNPEQMEQDIVNVCKLLDWAFKLKMASEENDGKIWCKPIN